MAFPDIQRLAEIQTAEDERKRRTALAVLATDKYALGQDVKKEHADEATDPAALLRELTGGKRAAVSGDILKNAQEHEFLNQQAGRRFERRNARLQERAADLSVPGPTAKERYATMSEGGGRFANEDPTIAHQELVTDPRGRLSAIDDRIEALLHDHAVSREASDRPIYAGRGAADEPYFTNLTRDELHAEQRTSNAIREKAGLEPQRGGPHGLQRIRVGGTSLGPEGPADTTLQAKLIEGLRAMAGEAERQPLTPVEQAQDMSVQQPGWDTEAGRSDPTSLGEKINQAVADRRLRPETAKILMARYRSFANASRDSDSGEFLPKKWQNLLATERTPAPGEVEARAKAGGQAVPQAEAAKQAAVQSALQAPPDAPGTTRSPTETQAQGPPQQALLDELRGSPTPSPTRTPQMGGAAPAEAPAGGPGWLRTGVGEAVRYGAPILGKMGGGLVGGILGKSPGAMMAGGIAGGAAFGAGGEAIANYLEDKPVDPKDELLAAILGGTIATGAKLLGGAGRTAGSAGRGILDSVQGYRAAPGVARGFQAVEEARQLGRGVMGAGQQLAGNIAAEGVPGLAETAIGERGRQLTPDLVRLLATRKGPKPSPAELEALLRMIGK